MDVKDTQSVFFYVFFIQMVKKVISNPNAALQPRSIITLLVPSAKKSKKARVASHVYKLISRYHYDIVIDNGRQLNISLLISILLSVVLLKYCYISFIFQVSKRISYH